MSADRGREQDAVRDEAGMRGVGVLEQAKESAVRNGQGGEDSPLIERLKSGGSGFNLLHRS